MLNALRINIENTGAKIGVIGLGYVGLPVACLFANAGFRVTGVDILPDRVDKINKGESPIEGDEPGLAELLSQVVESGRLRATTDYDSLRGVQIVFISVETPVDENHKPRNKSLKSALRNLAQVMQPGTLVIVESTIAPGTMDCVVAPLLAEVSGMRVDGEFYYGHCPERVMPGKLLYNIQNMDRVCGGNSPEVMEVMVSLYQNIVSGTLDKTDCLTAEIVKTTENAYRDVNIAFANEVALLCEALGANVWQVRELVNKSPGRTMLQPGAGVGGHCIPKDGWLLIANATDSFGARIIPQARAVNDSMPHHMFNLVEDALVKAGLPLPEATIAVFGYAYLENSGDTRNSPSEPLIEELRLAGSDVRVHDPFVAGYDGTWQEAAQDADAAVFMVAHDLYRAIDLDQLHQLLRQPILVDGRHIFVRQHVNVSGLDYRCVGVAGTE